MYRLNYPDDPGMHNSPSQRRSQRRRKPTSPNCHSLWEELKINWLTIAYITLLFTTVLGLHIWNELRSIQVSKALEESLRSIRKLTTIDVVFEENDNKLVHVVGQLGTEQELMAEDYGVSVSAVKLRQKLQMYQWIEDKSGDMESTSKPKASYTYYKTWVGHLVDSDQFHIKNVYENPKTIPELESLEIAQVVQIGNFILCKDLVDKINHFKPVTGHIRPQSSAIKLHAGFYYHTDDVWKPQIGDFRVEFAVAGMAGEHGETVSVIAKQTGRMLTPYVTESGDEILILKFGRKNPEDMIHVELSQNKFSIWFMRIVVGVILMFTISRVTKMLNSMVYVTPCLRDILNLGTAHFTMCLAWTTYTFTLGTLWIHHRPLLGLGFLAGSVLPIIGTLITIYLKDKSENTRNHTA